MPLRRGPSYWLPRVACLIFALSAVLSAFWPAAEDRFLDLHIYHGAVRALFAGQDPYTFSRAGYPFTYPPFALLALSPTWLPLGVLEPLWLVASVLAAWLLARGVAARVAVSALPARVTALAADRRTLTFVIAAVLFGTGPVRSHIDFGQISLFMMVATFADAVGRPGRRWGGVAIGICAAIKLTPLFFLPWLLVVGRRWDVGRALATFLVCTTIAWLVTPGISAYYWGTAVRQISRVGDLAATVNQSLHGVLLRSGLTGRAETIAWLLLAAGLGCYALARGRTLVRRGLPVESAIVAGCASLVVSPVTWLHHETWTVLAGFLLLVSRRPREWLGAALVGTVYVIPFPDLAVFLSNSVLRWPLANARALVTIGVCLLAFRTRQPASAGTWAAADPLLRTAPGDAAAGGPPLSAPARA